MTNNAATMTIGNGALLPLSGTVNNTGTIAVSSTADATDLEILGNGAALQGGGALVLSDNSHNVVSGSNASAVLTNVDNTISGAGRLGNGQLTLDNEAGGDIDGTGSEALVIDCKRLTSSPCEASIASITLNIDAPRQGRCCPEQVAR